LEIKITVEDFNANYLPIIKWANNYVNENLIKNDSETLQNGKKTSVVFNLDFVKNLVRDFLDKIRRSPLTTEHNNLIKVAEEISPEISQIITEKFTNLRDSNKIKNGYEGRYSTKKDAIIMPQNMSFTNILTLFHELGHAVCLQCNILEEVPSILAEYAAETKITQLYGEDIPHTAGRDYREIYYTIKKNKEIENFISNFENAENEQKKSNVLNKYEFTIAVAKYYVGTVVADILYDNENQPKLDEVYSILNQQDMAPVQKLKSIGMPNIEKQITELDEEQGRYL
jgi:hypothetical protein